MSKTITEQSGEEPDKHDVMFISARTQQIQTMLDTCASCDDKHSPKVLTHTDMINPETNKCTLCIHNATYLRKNNYNHTETKTYA